MAAVLWPRSGTRETDDDNVVRAGALAYFFDPGTTTPRTVYTDNDLSVPHAHPVEADAYGKWPAVYLPSGEYRYRLTTSGGVTIVDYDGILPSEQVDIDQDVVDPDLLLATGEIFTRYGTDTTRSGAVPCTGGTIGSAASGATVRANADCEDLFTWLWNQDDGVDDLTVSTGKGASAAADWAANKTITLPTIDGQWGARWVEIASGSLPAAAVQDITNIPATYDELELVVAGASSDTATRKLQVQISTDNGSSFITSGYAGLSFDGTAATDMTACIAGAAVAAAATATCTLIAQITDYQGGANPACYFSGLGPSGVGFSGNGSYTGGTSAVNALRILWNNTGNFDAGTYLLRGKLSAPSVTFIKL